MTRSTSHIFFSYLPEECTPKQAKGGAVVTLCIQPSLNTMETGTPYFAENDFWRQVLRCSAQRPGPALYSFGKTKVCHLENRERTQQTQAQRWVRRKGSGTHLPPMCRDWPECSRGGQWEGSQVSDLCIWGLVNGGTQMSALSGRRKTARVVHCKWKDRSVSVSRRNRNVLPPLVRSSATLTWTSRFVLSARTSLLPERTPSPCKGLSCPAKCWENSSDRAHDENDGISPAKTERGIKSGAVP